MRSLQMKLLPKKRLFQKFTMQTSRGLQRKLLEVLNVNLQKFAMRTQVIINILILKGLISNLIISHHRQRAARLHWR